MPAKLKRSFLCCNFSIGQFSGIINQHPLTKGSVPLGQFLNAVRTGVEDMQALLPCREPPSSIRHMGEPQLLVLALKTRDHCIKSRILPILSWKGAEEVAGKASLQM